MIIISASPTVDKTPERVAELATDFISISGFNSEGFIGDKSSGLWHIIWEERPLTPGYTPGPKAMPIDAWNHLPTRVRDRMTTPGYQWSNKDIEDDDMEREFVFTYVGKYRLLSETIEGAQKSGQFLNSTVSVADLTEDDHTYAAIGWSGGVPTVALHVVDDSDGRAIKFMSAAEALRLAHEIIDTAAQVRASRASAAETPAELVDRALAVANEILDQAK